MAPFGKCLLRGVFWGIWIERNRRIFYGKKDLMLVVDLIKLDVSKWVALS